jgi:hypothetical protein
VDRSNLADLIAFVLADQASFLCEGGIGSIALF